MGTYSTEMAALINYYPLSGILVQSISLPKISIKKLCIYSKLHYGNLLVNVLN